MTLTFLVWVVAQLVTSYSDFSSNRALSSFSDILFVGSTVPLGMALFLDPDHEPNRFDRLHILDFLQAILFWVTVYLCFYRSQMAEALWLRSLVYDSVLTGAFVLRAVLTRSPVVRVLFGRMALFLLLSGLADSYANYPGRELRAGGLFDLGGHVKTGQ